LFPFFLSAINIIVLFADSMLENLFQSMKAKVNSARAAEALNGNG
jgi:hypothetical protein